MGRICHQFNGSHHEALYYCEGRLDACIRSGAFGKFNGMCAITFSSGDVKGTLDGRTTITDVAQIL